jgi:hypothetical protein
MWEREYYSGDQSEKNEMGGACSTCGREDIIQVIKARRMRWAGHVARAGERTGAYRVLVGKSKEKRPLRRPRRRWEDNIKIDLQELRWGLE